MYTAHADRETIRGELEATHTAFVTLIESLSEDDWSRPTTNPAWTVGNILHHLVSSLELVPREVRCARQGKGLYNLPIFARDKLSAWMTRWESRRQSLASVADRYDAAYLAALQTLDQIEDHEWQLGAQFWGEGFLDIEGIFRSQARHLAEHAGSIVTHPSS